MQTQPQGFTLIELLIVIAIIGILSAVLVPNLMSARTRAHDTSAAGCAKHVAAAQEVAFIEGGSYAASLASLNVVSGGMVSNCEAAWVDSAGSFEDGWEVQHPNGSGLVYVVGPGGIVPPP